MVVAKVIAGSRYLDRPIEVRLIKCVDDKIHVAIDPKFECIIDKIPSVCCERDLKSLISILKVRVSECIEKLERLANKVSIGTVVRFRDNVYSVGNILTGGRCILESGDCGERIIVAHLLDIEVATCEEILIFKDNL